MIVSHAELFLATLPLTREFRTSSHRKNSLEHILVRMTSSEGVVGWGECASPSDPYFGPETVETCWLTLQKYLLPSILGVHWEHPNDVAALMARIRGNNFAKAAVDIACWDLWARSTAVSLATAVGASQSAIECGVSLGIEESIGDLLSTVGVFVDQGYRRVKLKIAPGWDVVPTSAVRTRFADIALQVDANGAYADEPASVDVLRGLDDLGLLMIEQPFADDNLLAHARAQEQLQTAICLDESITSATVAETALALRAARIVNIKVSRLGGIGPAIAVHDLCRAEGIPVWCGGMHEFGVGRAANIAVAALPGFTLPSDISGSDKYFSSDIVEPPIRADHGRVTVPSDRSGLGYEVDMARLSSATIRHEALTSNESGARR